MSISAKSRRGRSCLTEHVQADFLALLPRLVLGDAGVISFIHLQDVLYHQFGAVLVQGVLISRFEDDVVTVRREKQAWMRGQDGGGGCCLVEQMFCATNRRH